MKVEFQTVTLSFGPTKDEAPTAVSATTDRFNSTILDAEAALKSWELKFDRDDKEFHQGLVEITSVETVENGTKVRVSGRLGVRDDSGHWDDEYSGTADVLVIAIVASN